MQKIIAVIRQILEDEFEAEFLRFEAGGMLPYELHNVFSYCIPLLEEHRALDEEDKELQWLITGGISEYFEKEVNDLVSYGIQSAAKINQQYRSS